MRYRLQIILSPSPGAQGQPHTSTPIPKLGNSIKFTHSVNIYGTPIIGHRYFPALLQLIFW